MARPSTAPDELELVRAFANTVDVEEGTDQLSTPPALAAWLQEHGLPAPDPPRPRDLKRARALRDALRQVLLSHNGAPLAREAVDRLNATLGGATLEIRFSPHGDPMLEPSCSGIDAVIARFGAIAREAMRDGSWERLKICPADDCRWAFYDRSRNHSRTWCDMDVCGNRAKARAHRQRHGAGKVAG